MELNNSFEVDDPIDEAWPVITDVERIAPCLPGAQLQEVEGDEYRGVVKVKVGPITAQFKGTAKIVEQDDANHKAVIDASGRGTQGNASAVITVNAEAVGDRTKVNVHTDMNLTGKVAQFGRGGVMTDVSEKLMAQFAENLGQLLEDTHAATVEAAAAPAPAEPPAAVEETSGVRKIEGPEAEAVDLFETAGAPIAKRVVPVVVVIVLLLVLRRLLRK